MPCTAIIPISFLIANVVSLDFNNDSFTKIITFIWSSLFLLCLYFLIQNLIASLVMLFTLPKPYNNDKAIASSLDDNMNVENQEEKGNEGTHTDKSSSIEKQSNIHENTHICSASLNTKYQDIAHPTEEIESILINTVKKEKEHKAEILEEIIKYTVHVMSSHMDRENIEKLCKNIMLYAEKEYPDILDTVTTNGTLRSIDFRHFAWNIGKRLNYSGKSKATFIKKVFEQELRDSEISSLEQNLKQGGKCLIHIDEPQNGSFKFNLS